MVIPAAIEMMEGWKDGSEASEKMGKHEEERWKHEEEKRKMK
jgi:hypothetical protein